MPLVLFLFFIFFPPNALVADSIALGNNVHALKPVNRLIYFEFFFKYNDYVNAFSKKEKTFIVVAADECFVCYKCHIKSGLVGEFPDRWLSV